MESIFEPINLDGFASPDDLQQLSSVLNKLALYATGKAAAMRRRAAGNVNGAINIETSCERIYRSLPGWARW